MFAQPSRVRLLSQDLKGLNVWKSIIRIQLKKHPAHSSTGGFFDERDPIKPVFLIPIQSRS